MKKNNNKYRINNHSLFILILVLQIITAVIDAVLLFVRWSKLGYSAELEIILGGLSVILFVGVVSFFFGKEYEKTRIEKFNNN